MMIATEEMIIVGKVFLGLWTSSVIQVIQSNPSYAHKALNIARFRERKVIEEPFNKNVAL